MALILLFPKRFHYQYSLLTNACKRSKCLALSPAMPETSDPSPTPEASHTYLVEQYELHVSTYKAITTSAAEAIAKVLNSEAEYVEDSTVYVEVCEHVGMPVEGNEELAEQLSEMNVYVDEDKIPTIRTVQCMDIKESHLEEELADALEELLSCCELNMDNMEPATLKAIARVQVV